MVPIAIGSTQKSQRKILCELCVMDLVSDEFQERIAVNIMSTFEGHAGRVDAQL